MSELRLAGIVKDSIVDGPGIRITLFAQGCSHYCKGCQNPQTHNIEEGKVMTLSEILKIIDQAPYIHGVSFSGGEPFLQAPAFTELAREVRKRGLHIVLYTGYTYEKILELSKQDKSYIELLQQAQWLIDGPYIEEEKDLSLPFRGSGNQRIIDVERSLSSGVLVTVMD
ncbi:anaerobic ribonucleoside-triphosphate reductase activating protein [Heliorestis acidaminivorans]|nr:anaerobic ribonucleoside-triphosphate reductase activating protein [Heliorestis acidaminivorans]